MLSRVAPLGADEQEARPPTLARRCSSGRWRTGSKRRGASDLSAVLGAPVSGIAVLGCLTAPDVRLVPVRHRVLPVFGRAREQVLPFRRVRARAVRASLLKVSNPLVRGCHLV